MPKNKTSTFRELMKDPNKKADEASHVLAKLFRDILASQGMSATAWDNLMDKYYRKIYTNRHGVVDIIKVNQEKSNLTRALARDTLPWFRFETALQILGPKTYALTVTMESALGHKYKHTVAVPNRYAILPPQPEEMDDDLSVPVGGVNGASGKVSIKREQKWKSKRSPGTKDSEEKGDEE